jgi:hypothetical protein
MNQDYPHRCYRCKYIAHDKDEDFKHNLLVHHTLDFKPTLMKIKSEGLKPQDLRLKEFQWSIQTNTLLDRYQIDL